MCGICGIIEFDGLHPKNVDLTRKMADQLTHRGPDNAGYYHDNHCSFGFRRLSIIDLNTGDQPIRNEDGSVWIVFNGEIYNYRELRSQLEVKGYRFSTQTDTETIIHAYEEYGVDCLQYLDGMFAFAIWDAKQRKLFLARDRFGKKPLYYYLTRNSILFASELKALLQSPQVPRDIDLKSLDEYLTYHYVPAPHTILRDVCKLSPAHYLVVSSDNPEPIIRAYWQLEYQPKLDLSKNEAAQLIRSTMSNAVRARMISDVPLGALLSGGVDSSIVVGLMAEASSHPVKTFSIGFEEEAYDELEYARMIAKRFKTDHHEYIVHPEAASIIPKVVRFLDEPMADASAIPTYYVAQMARQHVTVVLNGDGADEIFGGYTRYSATQKLRQLSRIPRWLIRGLLKPILDSWPESLNYGRIRQRGQTFVEVSPLTFSEHYLRQCTTFSYPQRESLYLPEIADLIKKSNHSSSEDYLLSMFHPDGGLGSVDQMLRADILAYLPGDLLVKMDRMCMANSLEGRSPFLDYHLAELVGQLPGTYKHQGNRGKIILKQAFADLLPEEIRTRKKQGFGVPLESWFHNELRDMTWDILRSRRMIERGIFDIKTIKDLLEQHQNGQRDCSQQIWTLLVLEVWQQQFLDNSLERFV
jgi:asparagine synthase (glutamine-hydrolysing)